YTEDRVTAYPTLSGVGAQRPLGEILMAGRKKAADIHAEWNSDGVIKSGRCAIHICSVDRF
ncbi:MAG: hypothetical protein EBU76_07280, partial [Gammaproteobacteria bacterium]|nr:hypothetical protein [Gammaproteobacteria bacterium]